MSAFGFAIVGCGAVARTHVRALAVVDGARVAALVGRTEAAPRRLAKEMGLAGPVFTDIYDALERDDVHGVIVCTPSGMHMEFALAAAAAGRHVVVEKPLEVTTERCDRIIEACDAAGVKLGTIFPSRFADANLAVKAAIDAGRFGRLTLAETTCKWWRSQEYYDEGGWRGTWRLDGGGALMNQAIHNVDLLLWMMGEAESVTGFAATLAHERVEVEDTAVAAVRFRGGALGVILASTAVYPGLPKTIAVHGDRGSAVVEQDDLSVWRFAEETPVDDAIRARFARSAGGSGGASDPKAIAHEGHARQLRDFVAAVREGRRPAVDGREGRKAVALVEAVYGACHMGQRAWLADR
jgi:predicted dehydrogenase